MKNQKKPRKQTNKCATIKKLNLKGRRKHSRAFLDFILLGAQAICLVHLATLGYEGKGNPFKFVG